MPSQISKDLKLKTESKDENHELGSWSFSSDIYEALEKADAVVIITEWSEYRNLDWQRISGIMRNPAWLFDCRSITDQKEIRKTNINYWTVGNG